MFCRPSKKSTFSLCLKLLVTWFVFCLVTKYCFGDTPGQVLTFSSPISKSGNAVSIPQATSSVNGFLSSTDWTTFNGKQGGLTFSSPLVNSSGTVSCNVASGSVAGCLSTADWTVFNGKQSALTFSKSLVNTSGTVNLVNDAATPGNSKYYGTDSGGTLGYFSLPASPAWGSITGTLSNQTDLNTALSGKNPTLHIAYVQDIIADNGSSGAGVGGAWTDRPLTTLTDPDSIVTSLASNVITLPAGTYKFHADAAVEGTVNQHTLRLYNNTDSVVLCTGLDQFTPYSTAGDVEHLDCLATLSGSKGLKLQTYIQTHSGNNDFGNVGNHSGDGTLNVLAVVEIIKIK